MCKIESVTFDGATLLMVTNESAEGQWIQNIDLVSLSELRVNSETAVNSIETDSVIVMAEHAPDFTKDTRIQTSAVTEEISKIDEQYLRIVGDYIYYIDHQEEFAIIE